MSDAKPAIDDINRAVAVQELRETIRYAFYRCLSVPAIVERLLSNEHEVDTTCVHRLAEMNLSDADHMALLEAVRLLAARGEARPSRQRAKIDRTVLRILRLLPTEMSAPFSKQFFSHRLKDRRKWAYSEFRDVPLSNELAETLASTYRDRGDQEALHLIARNPACVVAVGADFLLDNLTEEYWRARVIEGVLAEDRPTGLLLAHRHPVEFAHAVGRLGDPSLLDQLCRLLHANRTNIAFLSIYAYALGKLMAVDQLNALSELVDSTFGGSGIPCGATAPACSSDDQQVGGPLAADV